MKDNVKDDKFYLEGYYSLDTLIKIIREIMMNMKVKNSAIKSLTIKL